MTKDKKEKKSKAEKSKSSKKHKKDKHKKSEKKEKKEKKSSSSHAKKESKLIDKTQHGDNIDVDDFFLKNEHFRVWCALIKKISFENLTSDEARTLFTNEFCKQYNRHDLPETFYRDEMPVEMREAALKTKHRWNIRVTDAEAESIQLVSDDVDFKTRHASEGAWIHMKSRDNNTKMITTTTGSSGGITTNTTTSSSSSNVQQTLSSSSRRNNRAEEEDSRDEDRKRRVHEKSRFREYSGVVMDELAPKESGRAAQLDKRRGVGAELKAAAREREDQRDGLDLPESVVMGLGGEDDFQATLARMNKGKSTRDAQRAERLSELQEREQQKQATFMAQLGVDLLKGPIKIAPRGGPSS